MPPSVRRSAGSPARPACLRSCMRRTPRHHSPLPPATHPGHPPCHCHMARRGSRDGSIGALESLFQAAVHASLQLDATGRGASIHLRGTGTLERLAPLSSLHTRPPTAAEKMHRSFPCMSEFLYLERYLRRAPFTTQTLGTPASLLLPHHPSPPPPISTLDTAKLDLGQTCADYHHLSLGLPTLDMLDRGPILPGPESIHMLGLLPGFCTFHDDIDSRNCPSTNKAGGPFPIQFRYYACQRCGSAPARADWSCLSRRVIWRLLRH